MWLSQSDALGWYTAFLQNAGGVVVVNPERCSGLVYGVPLGHGAEVNGGRARRLVDPGWLWWWRTRSYPRALLWAGMRCPVGTRGGGERWQGEAVGGPRVVVVVEDPELSQSVALGWYTVSRWDTGGGECC
jgi:hypothetical protein